MTTQISNETQQELGRQWLEALAHLIAQVEQWCHQLGWPTTREQKRISERALGDYDAPVLRARVPGGDLYVTPIAFDVVGAQGRVDMEVWPSLNRVKLLQEPGGWRIVTDSNVRVRDPWTQETFARLVGELAA